MAIKLTNDDFVLQLRNIDYATREKVERYEPFFEAMSLDRYAFQREAMRRTVEFLLTPSYADTSGLAAEHYLSSTKLQAQFGSLADYLDRFHLRDCKAVSLDLATGAGKSFVMYGIARVVLALGLVDKVLVLCPSLTIEQGLKDKFNELAARQDLKDLIESLGAVYPNPPIKSANDPILDGDICVENIHAVYDRTGSSISDSFKGQGARTLVLNDEAHHIYSDADAATKKWLEFLRNEEYGFKMIVGVSGTPYIGNDYFPDVIFRYGLKQAIDEQVVKTPDYVEERLVEGGVTFEEILHNHKLNRDKYAGSVKPVSIVVTEKILKCVEVWKELVAKIRTQDGLTQIEAEKRVIWVASGIGSGRDADAVKRLVPDVEKVRKQNLQTLRSVGDNDNPVQWIVSVSMLTEGWDVPNVFQVVPWESRAFNSKLLIAQVLGRGLRIPPGLKPPLLLTVANHERWTADLANLFKEVLEIENRVHSLPTRPQFSFPLFNLDYVSEIVTEQTQTAQVREPEAVRYSPQLRQEEHVATYSRSGEHRVRVDVPDIMPMSHAVTRMWAYLGEKDARIAVAWPKHRLREFIVGNLQRDGQPDDFLSRENLIKTQNAFGPMFRMPGATVARQKLKPNNLRELDPMAMQAQSVSEDQLRDHSVVYYTDDAEAGFTESQDKALWEEWVENYQLASRRDIDGIAHFKEALQPQDAAKFRCPTNLLIARYEPERLFIRELIAHAELFDAFLKNADSGFYWFPYSYKSAVRATSHAKTENFNPDFLVKLAGRDVVLVVEIKSDDDDSARNKAKLRDAKEHFARLNGRLAATGESWTYHFYFLSTADYGAFFAAVRDGRLGFKSSLMQQLEHD